ncbi:MAG TPA: YtxH domain-containing protein [Gemmatimonadaceae bacterium]|nr:YtxH domain-containing protein [Gemmatimonadaceae bacterium]
MAYAPGTGTTRTVPRAPGGGRPAKGANGRPLARRNGVPAVAGSSRRPTTTFLAGLGIGLAIGAAAALLLAPHSGPQLRRLLKSRGKKVGYRARDAWEDLRIELEATGRALKRRQRDAKVEIQAEAATRLP